jgi:hypothetical protein
MCKNPLRSAQMSDAAFIDEAAGWSRALTQREARGPGDLDNAMRRIEARYGIPFAAMWGLRYRRPKALGVSIYFRLRAAYEAECARQLEKLRHEIEITKITRPDHPAVSEVSAVVGEDD